MQKVHIQRQKKVTKLHPRRHTIRSDITLCHLLCLAGYSKEDVANSQGNSELFEDITNLIGSAKARLIKHTGLTCSNASRLNSSRDVNDLAPPPPDEDDEQATKLSSEDANKEMQSLLISKLPKKEYEKVSKLQEKTGGKEFKSYYSIAKDLPEVKGLTFTYDVDDALSGAASNSALDDGEGMMNVAPINNEPVTAVGSTTEKETKVSVVGAYVSFGDCVKILLQKIKEVVDKTEGVTMEQALDRAYFITCADGAQHNRLPKEKRSVITYSLTIVSRVLVERCGIYPSSSKWIIPHLQLQAKENLQTLRQVLQFRLGNEYRALFTEMSMLRFIPVYDIADGKALYIYTEHCHWASKNKPFLRCKCERGQSLQVGCQIITDTEYIELQTKSQRRWAKKPDLDALRARQHRNPYSLADHKKWCALENEGVSHFGALGPSYKISSLWFDVFHGRGGIVKVLLKYIRRMMEGLECRNYRCVSIFGAYLRNLKHWDGYVTDPWIADEQQSRLKGNHTKEFVRDIPNAINVLKSLMAGQKVISVCECLTSFYHMSKIVSITFIDQYESVKEILLPGSQISSESDPRVIAEEVIKTYEYHAKSLYMHGRQTVLTRFEDRDAETFYFHAFCWYVPVFMRKLYTLHGLGIAVMTMEGFEHKNFTSKHAVQCRTNGKGNILKQSLRVLHLFFKSGYHNVMKELQRRAKLEIPETLSSKEFHLDALIESYLAQV